MTTVALQGATAIFNVPVEASGALHSTPEIGGSVVSASNPMPVYEGAIPPLAYTVSTFATVTTSSSVAVSAGLCTKTLTLKNTGTAGNIWLNPTGAAAVVGSGIRLEAAGGAFTFGAISSPVPSGAIYAISDGGSNNLAICGV